MKNRYELPEIEVVDFGKDYVLTNTSGDPIVGQDDEF